MLEHGLQACTLGRYRSTTKASEGLPEAPNVLGRSFAVCGPNELWVSDITYIAASEGCYNPLLLDLCSRCVVGWR